MPTYGKTGVQKLKSAVYNAIMKQAVPTNFTKTSSSVKVLPGVNDGIPEKYQHGSGAYYAYFSQRVAEQTNDTWVKVYLPLLKEMDDGYVRLPGSGNVRK